MEVVPTDDGEDDGVIWLRCPQCQGFLPKISGKLVSADGEGDEADDAPGGSSADSHGVPSGEPADRIGGDGVDSPLQATSSPDVFSAETRDDPSVPASVTEADPGGGAGAGGDRAGFTDDPVAAIPSPDDAAGESPAGGEDKSEDTEEAPVEDYSAEVAAMDVTLAQPYRPWDSYALGDVIHHLAWDDCGVVVAEEVLPGQRKIIKVAFEKSGVHCLIVESSRS